MELTDYWKEEMTAFLSQLKESEHAQCEHISAIKEGISKWISVCAEQNK